jgi:hypothetical protein
MRPFNRGWTEVSGYLGGIFAFIFLVVSFPAYGFTVPERLEYDLNWMGIHAGTAVISIEKSEDRLVIRSQANSADFISVFYKVEDTAQSVVDGKHSDFGYPLNYHLKTCEGRHRKDKEVVFDRSAKKALYTNHLDGKKEEFQVGENIHDPLSGFFSVRRTELNVGKPVTVRIFDSKKVWDVEVEVLKKEMITVPAGTFHTILIKPKMKSEGIFLRKGDIYIWLTDDERKLPVMLRTKAPIGRISAELTGGIY